ncbi:cache domain-containing protein, partial [Thalassospira permensis]
MLQNIKISHKLAILSLIALIGLVTVSAIQVFTLRNTMLEDRKDKIRATTELLHSMAVGYQDRVNAGELEQQEAIDEFYQSVTSGRFEGEIGYFFAYNNRGINMMHAVNPALVGKDLYNAKDSAGTYFIQSLIKAPQGDGFFSYVYPKPGEDKDKIFEKLSFVMVLPWGHIFGTGIYIDDVDHAFTNAATVAFAISLLALVVLIVSGFVIGRNITSGLKALSTRMTLIASGELTGEIEGRERKDEVGEMARTVVAFREQAIENRHLQERQKQMEQEAETSRRQAIMKMADDLEDRVNGLIHSISNSVTEMKQATQTMQSTTMANRELSTAVASATAQTSANVQTVSAATEELSASSDEIAQQVSQSASVANQANDEATR